MAAATTPPAATASPPDFQLRASRFDAAAVGGLLCRRGFVVVDHFLGLNAARAVRDGIQQLDADKLMRPGKIQAGAAQLEAVNETRSDRIAFLPKIGSNGGGQAAGAPKGADTVPRDRCAPALLAMSETADALRERLTKYQPLVERVDGGMDGCNFMCATYPGGGARYVKHRDALPYKAGRKLTVIYYLNEQWEQGHGGELRIWPTDGSDETVTIEPLADRLLLFISSLEHEVLPAWRPRFALTTWLFNKRDTALELMAEEIRGKVKSGKLSTKELLEQIENATSSSEEEEEEKREPVARKKLQNGR